MQEEDFFKEGDELPEDSAVWHAPVHCPDCGSSKTRFTGLNYEMSVYVCEDCQSRFEVDEREG